MSEAGFSSYKVSYLAGTIVARKMATLSEGQFLDSREEIRPSRRLTELLTITQKALSLETDPFEGALEITCIGHHPFYVSRFKKATFFYIIRQDRVYICGVLFDWDRAPINPNGGNTGPNLNDFDTQISSISAEVTRVLRSRGYDPDEACNPISVEEIIISLKIAFWIEIKIKFTNVVTFSLENVAGDYKFVKRTDFKAAYSRTRDLSTQAVHDMTLFDVGNYAASLTDGSWSHRIDSTKAFSCVRSNANWRRGHKASTCTSNFGSSAGMSVQQAHSVTSLLSVFGCELDGHRLITCIGLEGGIDAGGHCDEATKASVSFDAISCNWEDISMSGGTFNAVFLAGSKMLLLGHLDHAPASDWDSNRVLLGFSEENDLVAATRGAFGVTRSQSDGRVAATLGKAIAASSGSDMFLYGRSVEKGDGGIFLALFSTDFQNTTCTSTDSMASLWAAGARGTRRKSNQLHWP